MKRTVLPVISFIMVFVLLMASFGTAKAGAGDDPVVTPVSGDMEFTTEIVPIVSLPGVTELAGGMLAPTGFPAGEAQFGGNGVLVTGMDFGKATACFSLSSTAIAEGWGGKVGLWNGSKWIQLPTTITTPEDSPNSMGCATITGSGTYAFIRYVVDPSLLPTMQACDFGIDYQLSYNYGYWYPLSSYNHYVPGFNIPDSVPSGTPVTYSVFNIDPTWPGTFISGLSGSTTANLVSPGAVIFSLDPQSFSQTPGPSYVMHMVFPTLNCYLDLDYYDYYDYYD